MATKTKDREEQLDDNDRESAETETQERDEGGDNEQEVSVKEKDGRQVVETTGLTRGQRRAAQREQQRREQAERERKTHELISRMQTQIETLTAAVANPQRQAPQPTGQVQDQDDWDKATDRQMELSQQMQVATDPEAKKRIMVEWRKLEREKTAFLAKGSVSKDIESLRQNVNQPTAEQRAAMAEFSDVLGNRRARSLAQGYYNAAAAEAEEAGRPFNQAKAFREANLRAARECGLRSEDSPEPSETQRKRFGGSGPSVGGGTDVGFTRPLTKLEVWTAKQWAEGNGIPEEKAVSAWTRAMLKDDPHYFRDNVAG